MIPVITVKGVSDSRCISRHAARLPQTFVFDATKREGSQPFQIVDVRRHTGVVLRIRLFVSLVKSC